MCVHILSMCVPASSASICTAAPCYSKWGPQTSNISITQELIQNAHFHLAPHLLSRTRSPGDSYQACRHSPRCHSLGAEAFWFFWIMVTNTVRNILSIYPCSWNGFYKTMPALLYLCLLFYFFSLHLTLVLPPFLLQLSWGIIYIL